MAKVYRILAKKATVALLAFGVFLLPITATAKVPNDTRYSNQAEMWNQIGAPMAWEYTTGSSQVVVAIIDTGADTWHPDLSNNIWTNVKEIPDNKIDDDNNGYVDDIHGWNFVEENNDPRTSVFDNHDDKEAVRHGTVIAGLIGAMGNNDNDGTGLNWKVKLMPLRAIDSTGAGSVLTVTKAIRYAVDNGANVISMSFVGKSNEPNLKEELYQAYKKGVVIVAAAGNLEQKDSGNLTTAPQYPVCYDRGESENWLLSVAAVDNHDRLSFFSNFGDCIDITAPGENIFSTERYAPQFGYLNEFGGGWEGTSFAAPLVAGAAALIKAAHPDWKPTQIIQAILTSVDSIDVLNPGFAGALGAGRLNIGKTMQAIGTTIPPVTQVVLNGAVYITKNTSVARYDVNHQNLSNVVLIGGAQVVAAAPIVASGEIAILLKRGGDYTVQVTGADGRFEREFTLPVAVSKDVVLQSLQVIQNGDYARGFVFQEWLPKKQQTLFVVDDQNGVKVKQFAVKGPVAAWRLGQNDPTLVYAQVIGRSLSVTQQSLDLSDKHTFVLPGVTSVWSLAVAPFWGEATDQVALLATRNKNTTMLFIDVASKSYKAEVLKGNDLKNPWYVAAVGTSSGGANVLQFKKTGGTFEVVDHDNALVSKVTIPKIIGTLQ